MNLITKFLSSIKNIFNNITLHKEEGCPCPECLGMDLTEEEEDTFLDSDIVPTTVSGWCPPASFYQPILDLSNDITLLDEYTLEEEYIDNKLSIAAIAKKYKKSKNTVSKLLKENGISIRNSHSIRPLNPKKRVIKPKTTKKKLSKKSK